MATTKVLARKRRSVRDRSYLWELGRGIAVSTRQFFRNIFARRDLFTVQYPEEQREYPRRYRGLHRLMHREDGQVRCVACMCCSTACPADCIHIVAAEHEDPRIEKYPALFVIDELRCIVCGFCVEACPCDAIRMDSQLHCEPFTDRRTSFFGKNVLMDIGSLSNAVQGGRIKKLANSEH
ncbi:MAG: NADH-quinone oxidoreductase subunit I [Bradymonadales bacterium]|nr:NADH-quinone oxidoreductase subunit I [Bradymonadales bacterium]